MIVRFFRWDTPRNVSTNLTNLQKGDQVAVEHEWGILPAEVLIPDKNLEQEEVSGRAIRKIDSFDKKNLEENSKKETEILREVRSQARSMDLPMKMVECKMSLDGSCAIVAFVADGRVDFRDLVRNISSKFGKSIRLQQIGSRDEARRCGGYGICGLELCCKKFQGSLPSITTEMARCQLISHRGSDRISGVCGRLMCCLSYEADQYQEMLEEFPPIGSKVHVLSEKKDGFVTDIHVFSKKIRVEFGPKNSAVVNKDEAKVLERPKPQ